MLADRTAPVDRHAAPAEAAAENLSRYEAHLASPLSDPVRATLLARLAQITA